MYTKILIICDLFASAANPLGIKIGIYIPIQLANSWTNPGIKQKSELKKKKQFGTLSNSNHVRNNTSKTLIFYKKNTF